MRNLKKRILSFVSAAVMVVTLLPTALFASAADEVTIASGDLPAGGTWTDYYIDVDLTDYESATLNIGASTAGWNWLKASVGSTSLFEEGDKGETTVSLDDFCGESITLYIGSNGTRTYTVTGVKAAEVDLSYYKLVLETSSDNGGTIDSVDTYEYEPAETVTLPTATANSGYTFVGWRDNSGNVVEDSYTFPETAPTTAKKQKVTLTAVFEKTVVKVRDLPIVSVTTKDGETSIIKDYGIDSWVSVTNTSDSEALALSAESAEFRGRGNSTWQIAVEAGDAGKYPYRLKFASKTQMLDGARKNKKWVLLANWADTSLLRNQIAFEFSKTYLTNIQFTTSYQQVELYVNGEYEGVYLLCEQTEVAKGRADIGDLFDEDTGYTGTGYSADDANVSDNDLAFMVEMDADAAANSEDFYFAGENYNNKQRYYTVKSGAVANPDAGASQTDSDNAYVARIKTYIEAVDAAIAGGNQTTIEQYIDVDSFVDMYILQELAKNCDVGVASFYMTKATDGKLMASPPWDFDRAFGNDTRGDGTGGLYVAGDYTTGNSSAEGYNTSEWYTQLCRQTWFVNEIKARFTSLYDSGAFDSITTDFDWDYWKNSSAVAANVDLYGTDKRAFAIYGEVASKGSYDNEVDYLSGWIYKRVNTTLYNAYYDTSVVSTTTLTINAEDYSTYTYEDNGTNVAIPFVVNDTTNAITITVPVTNAGDNTWANVFGPSGAGITWSSSNNNGDESADGVTKTFDAVQKYYHNVTGTVTVTIPAGAPTGTYYIGVTNGSLDSITIASVEGAVEELSSTPKCTVTATASPSNGGTISGAGKYESGETVTLTATANSGYKFTGWTKDSETVSTDATITFTVSDSDVDTTVAYTAVFEEIPVSCTVTAVSDDATMGTVEVKYATVNKGATGVVTATANEGYEFVGWYYNNTKVSSNATYSFTVTADIKLTAKFKATSTGGSTSEATDTLKIEAEGYAYSTGDVATVTDTAASEGEYARTGTSDGSTGEVFLPVTLPEGATYTIYVSYHNDGYPGSSDYWYRNQWFNLYQAGSGKDTSYDGTDYGKVNFKGLNSAYTSFTEEVVISYVEAGDYVIGLFGQSYANFDYIKIVATDNVFTGETTSNKISVSANPGKGGVVVSGSSASGTTVVSGGTVSMSSTITAVPRGAYKLVNWKDQNGVVISTDVTLDLSTLTDVTAVTAYFELKDSNYVYLEAENFTELISEDGGRVNTEYVGDYVIEDNNDDGSDPTNFATEKTGTIPFSDGEAVKLYGDSKAIAVPFTVPEDNEEMELYVGYNYGNLSASKYKDDNTMDSGLWINVYIPKGASPDYDAWTEAGWGYGEDALKAPVYPFLKKDYEGVFFMHLDNNTIQETTVIIPANAGAGQYFVSVATDQDIWNSEYSSVGAGQDIGYYDYIMLKTTGGSSEVTFAAQFYFVDMFTNTLASNDFSQVETVKNGETLEIYFSPKVPRYLWTQGYDIVSWEIYEGKGTSGKLLGTISNSNYSEGSENEDANTNESANAIAQEIEKLKYASGSVITFKAIYAVSIETYEVNVKGGDLYVMKDETDTEYSLKIGEADQYKVPNFGKVKLVASETNESGEKFSHWEANGFIYSYEQTTWFSCWTDVDFEAVYVADEVTKKPVAYIDTNVIPSGFETDDTSYHKITFLCSFYVPEGAEVEEIGIMYTNDNGLADLNAVPDYSENSNIIWQVPSTCVDFDVTSYADDWMTEGNQLMVSLYGSKTGSTRYAKAYIIYTENGVEKIVYSSNTAGIRNVGVDGMQETNVNYDND